MDKNQMATTLKAVALIGLVDMENAVINGIKWLGGK